MNVNKIAYNNNSIDNRRYWSIYKKNLFSGILPRDRNYFGIYCKIMYTNIKLFHGYVIFSISSNLISMIIISTLRTYTKYSGIQSIYFKPRPTRYIRIKK